MASNYLCKTHVNHVREQRVVTAGTMQLRCGRPTGSRALCAPQRHSPKPALGSPGTETGHSAL